MWFNEYIALYSDFYIDLTSVSGIRRSYKFHIHSYQRKNAQFKPEEVGN